MEAQAGRPIARAPIMPVAPTIVRNRPPDRTCRFCGRPLVLEDHLQILTSCPSCHGTFVTDPASAPALVLTRVNGRLALAEAGQEARPGERPTGVPLYQVGQLLGRGATATVYAARHVASGEVRAIKFLSRQSSADQQRRFLREARLLSCVTSDHVLRMYESGEMNGHHYMITELVPGGSLRDRLVDEGRLEIDEALRVIGAILEGLAALHLKEIVHRDLKPENVLGDAVKICDLGIAYDGRNPTSDDLVDAPILGTPRYMAPEQSRGAYSYSSDIYSAGVILHELLTGTTPGADAHRPAQGGPPVREEYRPLAGLVRGLSRTVDEALARALHPEPGRRHASAAAFRTALLAPAAPASRTVTDRPAVPAPPAVSERPATSPSPAVAAWQASSRRPRLLPILNASCAVFFLVCWLSAGPSQLLAQSAVISFFVLGLLNLQGRPFKFDLDVRELLGRPEKGKERPLAAADRSAPVPAENRFPLSFRLPCPRPVVVANIGCLVAVLCCLGAFSAFATGAATLLTLAVAGVNLLARRSRVVLDTHSVTVRGLFHASTIRLANIRRFEYSIATRELAIVATQWDESTFVDRPAHVRIPIGALEVPPLRFLQILQVLLVRSRHPMRHEVARHVEALASSERRLLEERRSP